jgi:hypothetical protein
VTAPILLNHRNGRRPGTVEGAAIIVQGAQPTSTLGGVDAGLAPKGASPSFEPGPRDSARQAPWLLEQWPGFATLE